jgi:hypothetical protein
MLDELLGQTEIASAPRERMSVQKIGLPWLGASAQPDVPWDDRSKDQVPNTLRTSSTNLPGQIGGARRTSSSPLPEISSLG